MQQFFGWGLLGAFVYLVQLVGFDGGFQDRHGSTQLHDAALRGMVILEFGNWKMWYIFNKTLSMNVLGDVEQVIEQIDDYDDIDVTNYNGNTPLV